MKDQLVIYARRIAQYVGYSDLVDGLQPLERLQEKYKAEIVEFKEALTEKTWLHALHEVADVAYYGACIDEQSSSNNYADVIRECEQLLRFHGIKVTRSQIELAALAKYEYRASGPNLKNEEHELNLIQEAVASRE